VLVGGGIGVLVGTGGWVGVGAVVGVGESVGNEVAVGVGVADGCSVGVAVGVGVDVGVGVLPGIGVPVIVGATVGGGVASSTALTGEAEVTVGTGSDVASSTKTGAASRSPGKVGAAAVVGSCGLCSWQARVTIENATASKTNSLPITCLPRPLCPRYARQYKLPLQ